jgi:hypothetical protein
VEIPSGLSITGESPLYDLWFRWTQSRHIATFDLTSVAEAAMRLGLRIVVLPAEPKIPLNLLSMRLSRRFTTSSDSVCGSALGVVRRNSI